MSRTGQEIVEPAIKSCDLGQGFISSRLHMVIAYSTSWDITAVHQPANLLAVIEMVETRG